MRSTGGEGMGGAHVLIGWVDDDSQPDLNQHLNAR